MNYCLFRLYSPLVSWGDIAVGGIRPSATHPSKSAIIGLIGAALGIDRYDDARQKELFENICFSVKVINSGTVLKDFHTIQVPRDEKNVTYYSRKEELQASQEKIGTSLSSREYRIDSLSIVCISIKNKCSFTLESIRNAIKRPVYHLYLGRKSCPLALPLEPQIIVCESPKEAFDRASFKLISLIHKSEKHKAFLIEYEKKCFESSHIYYFSEDTNGFDWTQKIERCDKPVNRNKWLFTKRTEYVTVEKAT